MPVEIRELSIKTQIVGAAQAPQPMLPAKELHRLTQQLRQQLLQECQQVLKAEHRNSSFER